jgi:ribosome-associated toxin RatA of RatAB toxin-antitoxin module
MDFSSPKDKLLKLLIDYVEFPKYLPHQIKSVEIIEKTDAYTITEETLHFSTVISKTFKQQTKHYAYSNNMLRSQILSGPAKNSTIEITINEKNSISHIIVNIDVKLEFKYKFLSPLIKKSYKTFLMSILYKMQSIANST